MRAVSLIAKGISCRRIPEVANGAFEADRCFAHSTHFHSRLRKQTKKWTFQTGDRYGSTCEITTAINPSLKAAIAILSRCSHSTARRVAAVFTLFLFSTTSVAPQEKD